MPTKSVYLLNEYQMERRRQQCQSLNNSLLEIMDAIVADYKYHLVDKVHTLARKTIAIDEKGRK